MASRKLVVEIVGDASSLERSFNRSSRSAKTFEHDIGKASRGAIAGSGAFRHLGRSIAFASGTFLGVASAAHALRESVDAAESLGKATRALDAQLKANGDSFEAAAPLIAKTNKQMASLGITSVDSETALARLARATGSVAKGAKDMGLAADLAAARHISLAQAAILVGKVEQGTVTAFNRLGIVIKKGTSVTEALAIAQRKLRGQAAANVTPLERLHAAVFNLEAAVGEALLPTIEKIADRLNAWISDTRNVERVQTDVRKAVKLVSSALSAAQKIITPLVGAFKKLSSAVGGTTNAFELLFALGIVVKLRAISVAMGVTGAAGLAGAAGNATKAVKALRAAYISFLAAAAIGGGFSAIGAAAALATARIGKMALALRALTFGPFGLIAVGAAAVVTTKRIADGFKAAQQTVVAAQQATISNSDMPKFALLVHKVAVEYLTLRDNGLSAADAMKKLKDELGGGLKAADLLASALREAGDLKKQAGSTTAALDTQHGSPAAAAFSALGSKQQAKLLNEDQRTAIALAKAQSEGTTKALAAAAKARLGFVRKEIAFAQKLLRDHRGNTKQLATTLQGLFGEEAATQGVLTQIQEAATEKTNAAAAKHAAAVKKAAAASKRAATVAQRAFEASVRTRLLGLRNAVNASKAGTDARRAAEKALLGALLAESTDEKLSGEKQAQMRAALIRERQRQAAEQQKDAKSAQQAITRFVELQKKAIVGHKKAEKAAKEAAKSRAQRIQFRALGLGAEGEELTPGLKALRTEASRVGDAVRGTFLDTNKTRSVMQNLRKILSGQLGAVGKDVRAKVKEILDGVDNQLKQREGDQSKFRHVSSSRILAGLGLAPEQVRALRGRIAAIGPAGTVPQRTGQFALAGGGTVTHIHIANFHSSAPDIVSLENELVKRSKSRPQVRRGAR